MDFEIRKLKMGLINYLDKVDLPQEVKRMVLKEVYDDTERKAEESIRLQAAAYRQQEEEKLNKKISEVKPVYYDTQKQEDKEA